VHVGRSCADALYEDKNPGEVAPESVDTRTMMAALENIASDELVECYEEEEQQIELTKSMEETMHRLLHGRWGDDAAACALAPVVRICSFFPLFVCISTRKCVCAACRAVVSFVHRRRACGRSAGNAPQVGVVQMASRVP